MCQIMEEIREEGVIEGMAKGLTRGKAEGRAESKVESIINLMESMDIPMERAMDILKVPAHERQMYADLVARKL